MPVNWTASGASPVIGSALAVTSGEALFAAPLPSAVKWLRFKSPSPPPAPAFTNTRNSSCVPSGGVGRSIVTSAQFCQPPVGATATEPASGPVGESRRASIVPPAPPEATRKRMPVSSSRFTGVYET